VIDPRIARYREAAIAISRGQFRPEIPEGGQDELAELGEAIRELGRILEAKFEELHKLSEITAKVNAGLVLEDVLGHVYDSLQTVIPYDRIGLSLLENEGRTLRARWVRSRVSEIRIPRGYAAPMQGSSLQQIIETGRPRILNDLVAHLRDHPDSKSTRRIVDEGMRSSLTCPLVAMGKEVGFMFFSSMEPHTYENVHVEIFQQIAGQMAAILEKSNLYEQVLDLSQDLKRRNVFIRKTFGRYISDDVVEALIDSPDGLDLGGEKRTVTLLMSDLRGFTAMSDRLDPEDVVGMLNDYLSAMVDIILGHEGMIDEIIGDSILVVFGTPVAHDDDPMRAAQCAVEMQRAMPSINAHNRSVGWPEIEMGIALHTGELVVGNIGSHKRTKYGVVGSGVNLTSRIERQTVGGQILASRSLVDQAGSQLVLGDPIQVHAKGFRDPVTCYDLLGIAGEEGLVLPQQEEARRTLERPLAVRFSLVDGKQLAGVLREGVLTELSRHRAVLRTSEPLPLRGDLMLRLVEAPEEVTRADVYAKTVGETQAGADDFLVHFTSVPPIVEAHFRELL
jgi:adenylate cyclase